MSRDLTSQQIQGIRDLHAHCVPPAEIARQLRLPQATALAAIKRLKDGRRGNG